MGGACVNVGCIPSKAMFASAGKGFDLSAIVDSKDGLVGQM